MERDDFPQIVDQPREIEVLGQAPMTAGLVGALLGGIAVGLLFELGGWMLHDRHLLPALRPALIAASAGFAGLAVLWFVDAGGRRGERFTFWEDRFERNGPGGMWLVRYGEIASIRFVSRARIELMTRQGQPRSIKHMVYSFMQRFQAAGGGELATRIRQAEIESGRPAVIREPLSWPVVGLIWLARLVVAGAVVWYCMALHMRREDRPAPYPTAPAVGYALGALAATFLIGRFGSRSTLLGPEGVRQGSRSIAWSGVERLTCNPDGLELRPPGRGKAAIRITWHASNAVAVPFLVRALAPGARVDLSEWASPWQLMGADPVSLAPPDFD
jgi:hypothetical protein